MYKTKEEIKQKKKKDERCCHKEKNNGYEYFCNKHVINYKNLNIDFSIRTEKKRFHEIELNPDESINANAYDIVHITLY